MNRNGKEVAYIYRKKKNYNIKDKFEEKFFYTTQEQFRSLPTAFISGTCDCLMSSGVTTKKHPILLMSVIFAQHMSKAKYFTLRSLSKLLSTAISFERANRKGRNIIMLRLW